MVNLGGSGCKESPSMQENWLQSLGWEDLLEKEMATHSSTLVWKTHGQRRPVGCSPRGHKQSDTTEQHTHTHNSHTPPNTVTWEGRKHWGTRRGSSSAVSLQPSLDKAYTDQPSEETCLQAQLEYLKAGQKEGGLAVKRQYINNTTPLLWPQRYGS